MSAWFDKFHELKQPNSVSAAAATESVCLKRKPAFITTS
jgi:hypothetical protein